MVPFNYVTQPCDIHVMIRSSNVYFSYTIIYCTIVTDIVTDIVAYIVTERCILSVIYSHVLKGEKIMETIMSRVPISAE